MRRFACSGRGEHDVFTDRDRIGRVPAVRSPADMEPISLAEREQARRQHGMIVTRPVNVIDVELEKGQLVNRREFARFVENWA